MKRISLLTILTVFLLIGCQQPSSDVTFVPIDDVATDDAMSSDDALEDTDLAPACSDGLDNDEDGSIDYPDDYGCDDQNDNDEENNGEKKCNDGLDNDLDDLVDQHDPGCSTFRTQGDSAENILEEVIDDTQEMIDDITGEEAMDDIVDDMDDMTDDDMDDSFVDDMMDDDDFVTQEPTDREIVIIVEETEFVSIRPVAYDPDQDTLSYTYTTPLSDEGEWQTTYGDMGEYTLTITASDGELTSSKDALLIVNKKEEVPTLDLISPTQQLQEINEDTSITFTIEASDLNSDPLSYEWKLNGERISQGESFTFNADYDAAGSHTIKVDVSDGTSTVSHLWSLTVNNVDRAPVLNVIPDITIRETEIIVLTPEASDPDGDAIIYTISDPVGDDGIWETTYDDAGVYTVEVIAQGSELADSQDVRVTVINVNRAPIIEDIIQVE